MSREKAKKECKTLYGNKTIRRNMETKENMQKKYIQLYEYNNISL